MKTADARLLDHDTGAIQEGEHREKWTRNEGSFSVFTCSIVCCARVWCKSFDFSRDDNSCLINEARKSDVQLHTYNYQANARNWDHYERALTYDYCQSEHAAAAS